MQDLGADVDLWDIDVADLAHDPDFPGMEVERDQAIGCVGVWGGQAGTPALALYGHTDVVPPGDLVGLAGQRPVPAADRRRHRLRPRRL